MLAVDCSIRLTADTAKALKASGVGAVGRYLGEWDKCMTNDEVSAITSAGLFIWSIYEGDPTSADYFTYAQGVTDAENAVKAAVSVSQPPGPIYFTVDYDAQTVDLGRIRDYVNGVRSAIGPYKVGLYGSYLVVTSIDADYKWQTAAWSNGQIAKVNLYQRQDDVQLAGVDVDMNDVYQNPGWWPTPKETHMQTLQFGSMGDDVKTLQTDLNQTGANLTVDGDFGPATLAAVKVFQKDHGLSVDGIVGPLTWGLLQKPIAIVPPAPQPDPPPQPAPEPPAPAPQPSPTSIGAPPTDDHEVVAVLKGEFNGDKFYISLPAKKTDGTYANIGHLLFDTGADCLLLQKGIGDAFGCKVGATVTINGVTGGNRAYESTITVKIGDTEYADQFCIIDPEYQGTDDGLFGLKFLRDNGLSHFLDEDTAQLTLYRKKVA